MLFPERHVLVALMETLYQRQWLSPQQRIYII